MAIPEVELQGLLREDLPTEPSPSSSAADDTTTPTLEIESLSKIVTTQHKLVEVKKNLGVIVDTIAANPSMISQAATTWGEVPSWQKIIAGVVLSTSPLALGLFAPVGALLLLSGVTGVAYTAGSFVLDDHYTCSKDIAERLKQGIFSLADVLQITIDALETIRQDLAKEIEAFREENLLLYENVADLAEQVDSLSSQVMVFIETEKLLRAEKQKFEEKVRSLSESLEANQELITSTNEQIVKITEAYNNSQRQLSEKVTELQNVRDSMGKEVEKARRVASTLQGAVQTLSTTVIEDKEQREVFQTKLDTFLADKSGFDQVSNRISKAEEELVEVKKELALSNKRYNDLLTRQELQIQRLERLDKARNGENVALEFDKLDTTGLLDNSIFGQVNPFSTAVENVMGLVGVR